MENMVIADDNLPAMCHVVCTLVATGIVGINVTSPVPVTTQPPPQQIESLPEGYVVYHDIGFAYKVYDEQVTWIEARKRCVQNGARLAVIDSTKKAQYVKNLKKSTDGVHVGIVRRYNTIWVDDTTGKELGKLPWATNWPSGNNDCVSIDCGIAIPALFNPTCGTSYNYVCEIPIIVCRNNRMTVN